MPPLVVDSFSMKHSPARFWLIMITVWLGSGPRNSTLRDVVWPKHREMVSQQVGRGYWVQVVVQQRRVDVEELVVEPVDAVVVAFANAIGPL